VEAIDQSLLASAATWLTRLLCQQPWAQEAQDRGHNSRFSERGQSCAQRRAVDVLGFIPGGSVAGKVISAARNIGSRMQDALVQAGIRFSKSSWKIATKEWEQYYWWEFRGSRYEDQNMPMDYGNCWEKWIKFNGRWKPQSSVPVIGGPVYE
jgi:hypothetical protein